MRRIRTILLGLALSLIVAAPAVATVELSEFKVEPSSLAAGGHPNVTITQGLTYSSMDDDVKDAFVRLPPGLLGNPQAAALCTQAQFAADTCPEASVVGSVAVNANLVLLPDPLPNILGLTVNGVVYNLRPTGSEPARIGMVLEAVEGLSKIFLQAPAFLRPGPDGYALETTFADQPRTSAGLNVQIQRIALTFRGAAARGPFMRMPTACGPLTAVGRVNSHDAPASFSQKTFKLTPTGCAALPFAPRAEGSVGAPGMTGAGDHPPVTTTLRFNPEHAALKRAEVTSAGGPRPEQGCAVPLLPAPAGGRLELPRELAGRHGDHRLAAAGRAACADPIYLAYNTPGSAAGPDGAAAAAGRRPARRGRGADADRAQEHVRLEPRPAGAQLHDRARRRSRGAAHALEGPLRRGHRRDDVGLTRVALRASGST